MATRELKIIDVGLRSIFGTWGVLRGGEGELASIEGGGDVQNFKSDEEK